MDEDLKILSGSFDEKLQIGPNVSILSTVESLENEAYGMVGIYYDERMLLHYSHEEAHYECPERLSYIIKHLSQVFSLNTKN